MKTTTIPPYCSEQQTQRGHFLEKILEWALKQKIEGAEHLSKIK